MKQTFEQTALDILITIIRYPIALVMLLVCLLVFLVIDWADNDAKIISKK